MHPKDFTLEETLQILKDEGVYASLRSWRLPLAEHGSRLHRPGTYCREGARPFTAGRATVQVRLDRLRTRGCDCVADALSGHSGAGLALRAGLPCESLASAALLLARVRVLVGETSQRMRNPRMRQYPGALLNALRILAGTAETLETLAATFPSPEASSLAEALPPLRVEVLAAARSKRYVREFLSTLRSYDLPDGWVGAKPTLPEDEVLVGIWPEPLVRPEYDVRTRFYSRSNLSEEVQYLFRLPGENCVLRLPRFAYESMLRGSLHSSFVQAIPLPSSPEDTAALWSPEQPGPLSDLAHAAKAAASL